MLRYFPLLSNLFQNESETDPTTTTPISNSNSEQGEQPGPKGDDDDSVNPRKGKSNEEYMDFEEGRGDEDTDEEEDDDWVLIGDTEDKTKGEGSKDLRVQEQPAHLVAAPSEPEKKEQDDQGKSEEEDEDDSSSEDGDMPALEWENKLIEHPSMSVYVDFATSTSTSMCNRALALFPGKPIVLHEDDDVDDMEITGAPSSSSSSSTTPEPEDVQDEMNKSDMENNANMSKSKHAPTTSTSVAGGSTTAGQNGRRKKGHYPCSSSNSSQMPRRAHLRSGGTTRANQTFHMISSNSFVSSSSPIESSTGQILDSIHDTTSKRKRANTANNPTAGATATASACGIAIVGGAAAPAGPATTSNLINKNLKLEEMFPMTAASAKKRQRHAAPNNTTPKGHFLQESKRRQDLQNHTKHSFVNNDRRSAQQRRVQKGAAGAAGSGARNTKKCKCPRVRSH